MRARSISLSLIAALALSLGGCATNDPEITGSLPDDVRVRHPINVTQGIATLDLIPGGGPGGLTDRQVGDIQSFAGEWRARGRGRLVVQIPTGSSRERDRQASNASREIHRILMAMGMPSNAVATARYPADGPGHLAPVRLEFPVLEARLPNPCGQWPGDVGYGDPEESNRNRQDWNFGCAYQQNLAAQVEDPEDFIRPRAESSAWARRRSTVIGKYGKGESTTTTYQKETVSTDE